LKIARDFVREYKIKHFYDMVGIGHIVLAEHGHLAPGMFACGGDSHSPMGGAYGCYMAGFGGIEMTGVCITGEIWTRVPETIRVEWTGRFAAGVVAKDISLTLCRELGMDNAFKAIEFGGETVRAMSMSERGVLCNMAAELGGETGVIEPDETTLDAMRRAGREPAADALSWRSDADAAYAGAHRFDAGALAPQVAAPHAPSNSGPVGNYAGVKVDQAYIGACVGAKLEDLHMVAAVLKGRKVAPTTRLLVAPASKKIYAAAAADGTLATLIDAGAIMLASGCGACAAMGAGILSDGEVCIASTNRNFKGRMGSSSAEVYLGSPYTVAAAAVAGRIADPREFLN
jgi:3-isopropylmalate/(R)-2-methylmalate dehydratase large subunit